MPSWREAKVNCDFLLYYGEFVVKILFHNKKGWEYPILLQGICPHFQFFFIPELYPNFINLFITDIHKY